jgi:hypothetical protein
MEDLPIVAAFKSANFSIDLDDALHLLRNSYSSKAHVVARLKNAALFEQGKDFITSKPPLSKHKYFLTVSCLERLSSHRGVIVKNSVASPRVSNKLGKKYTELKADFERLERREAKIEEEVAALNAAREANSVSEKLDNMLNTLRKVQEEQKAIRLLVGQASEAASTSQSNIMETIKHNAYWKAENWIDSDQLVEGYRVCEIELRALLEKDSPLVKDRGVYLFDMPCPRRLRDLKNHVWRPLPWGRSMSC